MDTIGAALHRLAEVEQRLRDAMIQIQQSQATIEQMEAEAKTAHDLNKSMMV